MMVSDTDARRLYKRSQYGLLVCWKGKYFAPKTNEPTELTDQDTVTIEVLKKAGGKSRIQVTQVVSSGKPIVETWTQKDVVFQKRGAKKTA